MAYYRGGVFYVESEARVHIEDSDLNSNSANDSSCLYAVDGSK